MPTRKQRKRTQKERRHDYETVWVDSEGNDLEEAPDDFVEPASRGKRADGRQKTQKERPGQRGGGRIPQPPSWRRAIRRSSILSVAVVVFFYIADSKASGGTRIGISLVWGIGYGLLFIPFSYYLDRFVYGRWQRKTGEQPTKR